MIAAATKSLSPKIQWKEADDMSRADLEEKAEFLGLIVMAELCQGANLWCNKSFTRCRHCNGYGHR